jgi:3-methylcrotonyl-CoA carboxylase alpha subunit
MARLMASLTLRLGAREVLVRTDERGHVTIDDHRYTVIAISTGLFLVSEGQRRWRVAVAGAGDTRWISVNGQVAVVEVDDGQSRAPRRKSAHAGAMAAPMPATVVKILVEAGQEVAEGATVLVLEAMKMELPIRAPRAGVVKSVDCSQGELVQPGVTLVELE